MVKKNGEIIHLDQRYISSFPIVMPAKDNPVVYVSDASEVIDPADTLVMEVTDRSKKTKLSFSIFGNVYASAKIARL
jgi:hypothetical protein